MRKKIFTNIVFIGVIAIVSCNKNEETNSLKKNIQISAGMLSSSLTPDEKNSISELTITGTIDARDFVTLYLMSINYDKGLRSLDLSNTDIVYYTGLGGTNRKMDDNAWKKFDANIIPIDAFTYRLQSGSPLNYLTTVKLPKKIIFIAGGAFETCSSLKKITVYNLVPFDISNGPYKVFNDFTLKNCILEVPRGSKSLYQNKWGFANIVEMY